MIDRSRLQPTVFLLDADPGNLSAMERLLTSEGFTCECFGTAEQFRGRNLHGSPGCLVVDVNLPDADGIDMVDALREEGIEIPVVFLMKQADIPTCVRAMRVGGIDFIAKPFSTTRLVDAVNRGVVIDDQARSENERCQTVLQRLAALTARQRQTLEMIVSGLTTKEIAARFGIGIQTAAKHRARVLRKMRVGTDVELTRLCVASNIDLPPVRASSVW